MRCNILIVSHLSNAVPHYVQQSSLLDRIESLEGALAAANNHIAAANDQIAAANNQIAAANNQIAAANNQIVAANNQIARQEAAMAVAQQDAVWQAVTFSLSLGLICRAAGGAAEARTRLFDSESEPNTIIAQITRILDANRSVATIVRQGLDLLRHLASLEDFQVSGRILDVSCWRKLCVAGDCVD
jgi:chromosome segregation ATPase